MLNVVVLKDNHEGSGGGGESDSSDSSSSTTSYGLSDSVILGILCLLICETDKKRECKLPTSGIKVCS